MVAARQTGKENREMEKEEASICGVVRTQRGRLVFKI